MLLSDAVYQSKLLVRRLPALRVSYKTDVDFFPRSGNDIPAFSTSTDGSFTLDAFKLALAVLSYKIIKARLS